ncbi:hypothetical protein [Acidovorax sp. SUPP2825]|uniref:hypothetical protein n=1 Tax=Acidovorax sp. SUPP2825 TaxID=2920879 RepID=UPI0023DE274C|nr:hypothetical protein [Acidovorax sp. SUPP2825]GKS97028.1 hypothetical protein AVAK2825_20855 [Acidovorax sp. SUPP2825]
MPEKIIPEIALVPTAVLENGVRRVVQAGEPLPVPKPAPASPEPSQAPDASSEPTATATATATADTVAGEPADASETPVADPAQRRKR